MPHIFPRWMACGSDLKRLEPKVRRFSWLCEESLTFHAVFVRRRIPQKPSDDGMYYQFDYQKIIIWNLRYEQVAFLDADMVKALVVSGMLSFTPVFCR